MPRKAARIVAIGGSTGGPQALHAVIASLPERFPLPVVIVQHMPPTFIEPFARRLDAQCDVTVKVAAANEVLRGGWVYIAPGGSHTRICERGGILSVELSELDVAGMYHKPSVDVTFESVAIATGGAAMAAVLTGMGRDGARGAKMLHDAGAMVIAQDEQSCIVYGMPRAVVEEGAADNILPVELIGDAIAALAMAPPNSPANAQPRATPGAGPEGESDTL